MQQVAFVPPPLPPKTRRQNSGGETTVHQNNNGTDVFGCSFPEINGNVSTSSTATVQNHVVKIRINPQSEQQLQQQIEHDISEPCVRISVNSSDIIQNSAMADTATSNYFFYGPFNLNNVISSGQVSPSDTLDSGTCSDLDITTTTTNATTPPPLPTKKKNAVSVTLIGHKRDNSTSCGSQGDSDNDNDSNLSYDSLNSGDLQPELNQDIQIKTTNFTNNLFPQGLLKDIRDRTVKLNQPNIFNESHQKGDEIEDKNEINLKSKFRLEPLEEITEEQQPKRTLVIERTYEQRDDEKKPSDNINIDPNLFFNFHINEHVPDEHVIPKSKTVTDETFAGYKDLLNSDGSSTIRSAKGTVRGVKNRVRNGIATFLQINSTTKVSALTNFFFMFT